VIRKNEKAGLEATITNFVPQIAQCVELMQVRLRNISTEPKNFTPIGAIPLFGRSADSIRDHRHVTSLLNRVTTNEFGVVLQPVMSFDERGHNINQVQYAVLGTGVNGQAPKYIYPYVDAFIGEGGALDRPLINLDKPFIKEDLPKFEGSEAIGALRFNDVTLQPDEECNYHLVLAIGKDLSPVKIIEELGTEKVFQDLLDETSRYWAEKLDKVKIYTGDSRWDQWSRWVSLQPILRRLMGNSFLPYHDYGRGGRGWRDLWQDALGLLLMESEEISEMLYAYFAGIRMDGSNATIIGNQPGEFKADRNEIPRVWMDHGVWPLKTLDVYLGLTCDYEFLLREQTYFKDHLTFRTRKRDQEWKSGDANIQTDQEGKIYQGTVYEHLLIQHLTTFLNAGEYNNLLLEGGDWNDGIDMAANKGESVAFSAFYAGNLKLLADYAGKLIDAGIEEIEVAEELSLLLDRCFEQLDYTNPGEKQTRLQEYFWLVSDHISGEKVRIKLEQLKEDLDQKSTWLNNHIRQNEWIDRSEGAGWFNGYYDNNGKRVEGVFNGDYRMTLTGQVFPIMAGVATDAQIVQIIEAVNQHLFDWRVGGVKLNTDFKEIQMALGRAFGFAYGHKENGAMFSHMAMMYAYALYQRGYAREGYAILESIYQHCQNFQVSKMYPGIPEYIGPDGRGYYFYLTGSASWYLFTMITQVFGIRGEDGDLVLNPKLMPEQFDADGKASIRSHFAGRELEIEYINPGKLTIDEYRIGRVLLDGGEISIEGQGKDNKIDRDLILGLSPLELHIITVEITH
jgi:cellobiose phosphorylase